MLTHMHLSHPSRNEDPQLSDIPNKRGSRHSDLGRSHLILSSLWRCSSIERATPLQHRTPTHRTPTHPPAPHRTPTCGAEREWRGRHEPRGISPAELGTQCRDDAFREARLRVDHTACEHTSKASSDPLPSHATHHARTPHHTALTNTHPHHTHPHQPHATPAHTTPAHTTLTTPAHTTHWSERMLGRGARCRSHDWSRGLPGRLTVDRMPAGDRSTTAHAEAAPLHPPCEGTDQHQTHATRHMPHASRLTPPSAAALTTAARV